MMLGVTGDENLIYEGNMGSGLSIWPSPILTPAAFTTSRTDKLRPDNGKMDPFSYIFREDNYDPVSRVRRGRFYRTEGHSQWYVYPHPAMKEDKHCNGNGQISKQLVTYHQVHVNNILKELDDNQPLVLLGTDLGFTVWTIASIERITSKDELVMLKSRQNFGALPVIHEQKIPEDGRDKVLIALETLSEDIFRAGAESVVDRSREAVTAILSIYLRDLGLIKPIAQDKPTPDLGALIKVLSNVNKEYPKPIVINLADTVRLFHSRGKYAVKEGMNTRTLVEQDAELSVSAVGTILCDIGWASW